MNYNYTFSIFQPTETKNCTSGLACDPQFDFSCKCILANHFACRIFFFICISTMHCNNYTEPFSLRVSTIGFTDHDTFEVNGENRSKQNLQDRLLLKFF